MKIRRVEAVPVAVPFSHGGPPVNFGGPMWRALAHVLVRVDTDEGVTGYGESYGFAGARATKVFIDQVVAPLLVGREAEDPSVVTDWLRRSLVTYGTGGIVAFALAGVDIGLWDVVAKMARLPLARLLGGTPRRHVAVTPALLSYGDPEGVGVVAREAAKEGFERVKVRETTFDAWAAARRAVGPDVELSVDVDCAWSAEQAMEAAPFLERLGIRCLEEPTWPPDDVSALAKVRKGTALNIAAGEHASSSRDLRSMLEAQAVDLLQPSLTRLGGISEYLAAAKLAQRHGVALAPQSHSFGPGFAAMVQLAACATDVGSIELPYLRLDPDLYEGALEIKSGEIEVPQRPGLGVDPDPAVLRRFRMD